MFCTSNAKTRTQLEHLSILECLATWTSKELPTFRRFDSSATPLRKRQIWPTTVDCNWAIHRVIWNLKLTKFHFFMPVRTLDVTNYELWIDALFEIQVWWRERMYWNLYFLATILCATECHSEFYTYTASYVVWFIAIMKKTIPVWVHGVQSSAINW